MKKLLGISLVAIMSVSAANAEIASKAYVDQQDGAVEAIIGALDDLNTGITNTSVVDAINSVAASADGDVSGLDTRLTTAEGKITTAEGNITTLMGADTVAGSVAKAEKDAKTYADSLASNYATAEQGAKADTALQPENVTASGSNGVTANASDGAITVTGVAATTSAAGVVQLADAAAVTAGTAGRVVDAAQLKSVADTASGALNNYYTKSEADAAFDEAGTAADLVGELPTGQSTVVGYIDSVKSTADGAVQSVTKSGDGNILTGITTTDNAVTVTVSGTAIPQPSGNCADCVLHYNGTAYSWEEIAR